MFLYTTLKNLFAAAYIGIFSVQKTSKKNTNRLKNKQSDFLLNES